MQALNATFEDISVEHGRGGILPQFLLGSAILVLIGCAGVFVLHARHPAAPRVAAIQPAPVPAPAKEEASNPYGDIIIDPSFLAEMKPAGAAASTSPLASLEANPQPRDNATARSSDSTVPSALAPDAAPPAPFTAAPALPGEVPLPPKRDVPQVADSAPLPPRRPAEFALRAAPATPERSVTQQSVAPSPSDHPNFFQKLFGMGQSAAPQGKAEPGAAPYRTATLTTPAPSSLAATSTATAPSPAVQQGRGGFGGLFAASTPTQNFDKLGYDRFTAVYDISARAVYLPDGRRLEAHSGLGEALDNPRYVSERAVGPTPPHLYELTLREASFHGVQALRLNPVGEDGLYGRAGLLAHPYMLGPNGDSNGCVSVKDYDAFLRAYENGQIRRLAVVAGL